jgi:hypothetical protein
LFGWVDELVRKTWRGKHVSLAQTKPARPTTQRMADREWVNLQSRADHEARPRRSPTGREAPTGNRSAAPGCGRADQAPPQSAGSIGQVRRGVKRINQAVAFLLRELANGEVVAACLEEKAKAIGISLRTLDRARAQLNVTCRRTGFAKTGKSWLSLPITP